MPLIEVKDLPLYDYKCSACGHAFTQLRPVAERENAQCPRCESKQVRQVLSPFTTGIRRSGRQGCGAGGATGGG